MAHQAMNNVAALIRHEAEYQAAAGHRMGCKGGRKQTATLNSGISLDGFGQQVRGETFPAAPWFRNARPSVGTWEPPTKTGSFHCWAVSEQTLIIYD